MVLGTVKNDIHDFGEDIVATVLNSNGVEITDLGVNVEYQAGYYPRTLVTRVGKLEVRVPRNVASLVKSPQVPRTGYIDVSMTIRDSDQVKVR